MFKGKVIYFWMFDNKVEFAFIDNLLVRSAMGNEFKNLKFDKDIEARNEYTDEDLKWIAGIHRVS